MNELNLLSESERPHIIAVTETWFKSTSLAGLDGYDMFRKDRADGRRGGGVVIYVNQALTSYEPFDVCFNLSKLEQTWSVVATGKC